MARTAIAKKKGSSLKAEVSLRGAAALMDARACWCYITTNCRGLLESPDASLMSDAMLESSRDVETSKIAKMGHQDVFGLVHLLHSRPVSRLR